MNHYKKQLLPSQTDKCDAHICPECGSQLRDQTNLLWHLGFGHKHILKHSDEKELRGKYVWVTQEGVNEDVNDLGADCMEAIENEWDNRAMSKDSDVNQGENLKQCSACILFCGSCGLCLAHKCVCLKEQEDNVSKHETMIELRANALTDDENDTLSGICGPATSKQETADSPLQEDQSPLLTSSRRTASDLLTQLIQLAELVVPPSHPETDEVLRALLHSRGPITVQFQLPSPDGSVRQIPMKLNIPKEVQVAYKDHVDAKDTLGNAGDGEVVAGDGDSNESESQNSSEYFNWHSQCEYACRDCSKVFYRGSTLESHIGKRHAMTRDFYLQKHKAVSLMTKRMMFTCGICGGKISQTYVGMLWHAKNTHGMSLEEMYQKHQIALKSTAPTPSLERKAQEIRLL